MRLRHFFLISCLIFLTLSIYLGNIGKRFSYYKDILFLSYLEVGKKMNSRKYPKYSFEDYLSTQKYLNSLGVIEAVEIDYKDAIENNSKLSNAIGLLTIYIKSQRDLINRFPRGLLNIHNLVEDLKTHEVSVPHGKFNNNYINDEGLLIFGEDIEIASLIYNYKELLNQEQLKEKHNFARGFSKVLKEHWIRLRDSGGYGKDGLSHGKRNYSKNTLLSFSQIDINMPGHQNICPNRLIYDALVRACFIGLDDRITPYEAYMLGESQSYITNADLDMASVSGVFAEVFNYLFNHPKTSKKEFIDYLMKISDLHLSKQSLGLEALYLGINLKSFGVNPIMVYNSIAGFSYHELITLVVYSVLYFEDFASALPVIIHTTGNNDTVAMLVGIIFALIDGKSVSPELMKYLEAKDLKIIRR